MKCVGTTTGTSRPRPLAMSSPKSRDTRNVFHSRSLIAASCFLISIARRVLASTVQMGTQCGRVVSVNVGRPREIVVDGEVVRTSIWKDPVDGRVAERGAGDAVEVVSRPDEAPSVVEVMRRKAKRTE